MNETSSPDTMPKQRRLEHFQHSLVPGLPKQSASISIIKLQCSVETTMCLAPPNAAVKKATGCGSVRPTTSPLTFSQSYQSVLITLRKKDQVQTHFFLTIAKESSEEENQNPFHIAPLIRNPDLSEDCAIPAPSQRGRFISKCKEVAKV